MSFPSLNSINLLDINKLIHLPFGCFADYTTNGTKTVDKFHLWNYNDLEIPLVEQMY